MADGLITRMLPVFVISQGPNRIILYNRGTALLILIKKNTQGSRNTLPIITAFFYQDKGATGFISQDAH